jgi:hypothetical protein
MKIKKQLSHISKSEGGKIIFISFICFSLFSIISLLIQTTLHIDPNINYSDLQEDGVYVQDVFKGRYYITEPFPLYFVKRLDTYISIDDFPAKPDNPEEYVNDYLNKQLAANGWILISDFRADKNIGDCQLLVSELDVYAVPGEDYFSYRRDGYSVWENYAVADLICVYTNISKGKAGVNVTIVTAKPTLLNYILEFLAM